MTSQLKMTSEYTTVAPARGPGYAELQKSVEALLPLIEAEAEKPELQDRLSDRVVAELKAAGVFAMLLPKELGGSQLSFVEAMRLVERLAWADGSTGWYAHVYGQTSCFAGAYLPDQGVARIYGEDRRNLLCGSGAPTGTAQKVADGYIVKGRWGYGSGFTHANWIQVCCRVVEDGKPRMKADGSPEIRWAYVPRDQLEAQGDWDVIGLRATGSVDYGVKGGEMFVAEALSMPMIDDSPPRRGGAQYGIGVGSIGSWGHTSWALGVGGRALDEINRIASERKDLFGTLADSLTFRKSFAEATARYRSARAFVYESWESISGSSARGDPASLEQIALMRLAMRHLHDVMSEVATFAHRASRGVSLRPGKLQRVYRDAHAGTQHLLLADEIMTECARVLLRRVGPNAKWGPLSVKDPT